MRLARHEEVGYLCLGRHYGHHRIGIVLAEAECGPLGREVIVLVCQRCAAPCLQDHIPESGNGGSGYLQALACHLGLQFPVSLGTVEEPGAIEVGDGLPQHGREYVYIDDVFAATQDGGHLSGRP